MDWEAIKNKIISFFQNSGLNILYAILAFVAGLVFVKLIVLALKRIFSRTKMEKVTQGFFVSTIRVLLYVCLVFVIAQILGINTTGFLAVLSTAGIAVSLALQSSLSNLANGVVLLITHPFKEGDFVSIGGVEGTIKTLDMTHTVLVSVDNKLLSIPNSTVVSSVITNYNVLGKRKIIFNFAVDYASDIKKVKEIINSVMYSNGKIKLDPAPFIALKTLNDSSLGIMANCWVDSEDYWDVFYFVTENVFNEFKRNKISIPFNQMEVRLREDSVEMPVIQEPLPERIEKPTKEVIIADPIERMIVKSEKKRAQKKAKKQAAKTENKEKKSE
ncbi:MAG TPA: hypothetical protein DCO89_03005 [Clostridiales bacterium]|nr:hypothetical protein [Clostridiales bacterium]